MSVGFVCPQCDALTELGAPRCPSCGSGLGWNGVPATGAAGAAGAAAAGGARAPVAAGRNAQNVQHGAKNSVHNSVEMEARMASSPMKTCPSCGTPVPADDRFCGKCGSKLAVPEAPAGGAPGKTMYFAGE